MLKVVSLEEALSTVRDKTAGFPDEEKVNITDSLGRILCSDIVSAEDIPPFDRSTVDGYAVSAADTFGAGSSIPAQLEITGEILMGESAGLRLGRGQCAKISTGGMLPEGADAAVMVEHTDTSGGICLVYRSVAPRENITKKGDDISAGNTVLKKGTKITSAQTGILAALGINEVPVFRKPVAAVISTGDEIVTGKPEAGQIRDINTFLLSAALREYGCDVIEYGAVRDSREGIEKAVGECIEKADMVLISGGSSAGTRDMTTDIISSFGEVFFHGIAMKPGKPTVFGTAGGKPVFGLPGHPLAAYFVFRLIVTEYIRKLTGEPGDVPFMRGTLGVNIPSNHGREEFLCVRTDENGLVFPVHTKSGIISVLSNAQGYIRIPRDSEGMSQGTQVEVYKL